MTANTIANKQAEAAKTQAETSQNRQKEDVRHNKQMESIGKVGNIIKGVSSLGGLIGKANDPSWYNLNADLVRDVASISFNLPQGSVNALPSRKTQIGRMTEAIPGILALGFVPTLGKTNNVDEAQPQNIAARSIYSYVRYNNSGARNYDAPDLMMYLLAMDSAYMMYATMVRLYGLLQHANSKNWYLPKALITAMGYDFTDFIQNMAQLRAYINSYAQRISAFNVPNIMPYYARHTWMVSNVFKDSELDRAQLYVFVPRYYYSYDNKAGNLIPNLFLNPRSPSYSFQTLIGACENILTSIVRSEDIGIMSGDILKAYGEEALYKVGMVEPDYKLEPIYSQEVLSQINSAFILPDPINFEDTYTITQDESTGAITQKLDNFKIMDTKKYLGIAAPNAPNITEAVINIQWENPTPDDVMVASRLAISGTIKGWQDKDPSAKKYALVIQLDAAGSEVIQGANLFYYNAGGASLVNKTLVSLDSIVATSLVADNSIKLNAYRRYQAFDWAPIIYCDIVTVKDNGDLMYQSGYSSLDVANYAILASDVVQRLHSVAIQSLFGIPLLGNKPRKFNTSRPTHSNSRNGGSRGRNRSNNFKK